MKGTKKKKINPFFPNSQFFDVQIKMTNLRRNDIRLIKVTCNFSWLFCFNEIVEILFDSSYVGIKEIISDRCNIFLFYGCRW